MATYEVLTPDGARYEVNAPDGATEQDALAYVRQRHERSLADVPGEAMQNAGQSLLNYGKSIGQAIAHPIDTAKAVSEVGLGAAQNVMDKINLGGLKPNPKFAPPRIDTTAADVYGAALKDRYGGWENIKNTMATDPVGVLADVATVAVPAGGAAARLPGMAGDIGRVVQTAGKIADPLTAAGYVVKGGAKLGAEAGAGLLGGLTGAGTEPIKEAARVGADGTKAERAAFMGAMRGTADPTAALDSAKNAVARMRIQRGNSYRDEMAKLGADKTTLDFAPVQKAWADMVDSFHVDGGLSKAGKDAQGTLEEAQNVLAQWEREPGAHTVNGLDGLKQRLRAIYPDEDHTQPSRIIGALESAVKNVINTQAPQYAGVMERYATESQLIREAEKSLSLGNAATADTAMRKLQSITRNNVNTNYGNRLKLVEKLENFGADTLRPAVAGQALNSALPRGLAQVGAGAGATYVAAAHPGAWPAVAAASPRIAGETVYGASRLFGPTVVGMNKLADTLNAGPRLRAGGLTALQAGRLADMLNEQNQ